MSHYPSGTTAKHIDDHYKEGKASSYDYAYEAILGAGNMVDFGDWLQGVDAYERTEWLTNSIYAQVAPISTAELLSCLLTCRDYQELDTYRTELKARFVVRNEDEIQGIIEGLEE